LGYLKDENPAITIDKKYEDVISSLREELTIKEKTLEELYLKFDVKEDHFSDLDKQNIKITELTRTVTALTEELSSRKEQLEITEKLVSNLKDDFTNAYDKGMRANKAIKHEFETNLHKAESNIKLLEQRVQSLEQERDHIQLELRKSDRALSSARKVAMVERNFLEVIKKIENKRKEKKMALDRALKDRAEEDSEEKKKLKTKIKILKEAYNKLNEQYQSSQALEKDFETKIKECEKLKGEILKLARSVLQPAPVAISNSPRAGDSITIPAESKPTPILVGNPNQAKPRDSKTIKWALPPTITTTEPTPATGTNEVVPSITIQSSSPNSPPAKWSSVKNRTPAKDI